MKLRGTHEVMKDAIDKVGVKKVASSLDVSTSLVYKWCQEPKSDSTPDASGVTNPLDRLLKIYSLTDDLDIIHYICRVAGGYFTLNPPVKGTLEIRFITETIQILDKFADLMRFAERSLFNDGAIDNKEATTIRRDWDKLKSQLERFVTYCESGAFNLSEQERKTVLGSSDKSGES